MNKETILAIVILAVAFLWWRQHSMKGAVAGLGRQGGIGSGTIVRSSTGASTTPTTRRRLPAQSNAWRAGGNTLSIAPTAGNRTLNARGPGNIGTTSSRGGSRSRTGSAGGTGISPRWPRNQVTSTRNIPIASGTVQIPSWAAVPTTTQGIGGQGTIRNNAPVGSW